MRKCLVNGEIMTGRAYFSPRTSTSEHDDVDATIDLMRRV
jgi:hypothetical protein